MCYVDVYINCEKLPYGPVHAVTLPISEVVDEEILFLGWRVALV